LQVRTQAFIVRGERLPMRDPIKSTELDYLKPWPNRQGQAVELTMREARGYDFSRRHET
jgi:hypothetical protein